MPLVSSQKFIIMNHDHLLDEYLHLHLPEIFWVSSGYLLDIFWAGATEPLSEARVHAHWRGP